jgi:hypothetical protein
MKKFNLFIHRVLGYKYLVNLNTYEIHRLKNIHPNCQIELIKDGKYITKNDYPKYIIEGDGCRWCNKKDNLG